MRYWIVRGVDSKLGEMWVDGNEQLTTDKKQAEHYWHQGHARNAFYMKQAQFPALTWHLDELSYEEAVPATLHSPSAATGARCPLCNDWLEYARSAAPCWSCNQDPIKRLRFAREHGKTAAEARRLAGLE